MMKDRKEAADKEKGKPDKPKKDNTTQVNIVYLVAKFYIVPCSLLLSF